MPDTYKRLNTVRSFSSAAVTTIYTVPALTTALIRKIQVSNNGTNSGTVKLMHVESGGTPDSTHVILPTTPLGVNEGGMDDEPFAMSAGDTIRAVGDGVNDITIHIYGMEVA